MITENHDCPKVKEQLTVVHPSLKKTISAYILHSTVVGKQDDYEAQRTGITPEQQCLDVTGVLHEGLSTIKAARGGPAEDHTFVCQHT